MMYAKTAEAVVSINGHMIRPVLGRGKREQFQVDGTGRRFDTQDAAEEYAEGLEPKRKPRYVACGCCTGGCVCDTHKDLQRGVRSRTCGYHSGR